MRSATPDQETRLPTTLGQEALWVEHHLDPEGHGFNVVAAVTVSPPISEQSFGEAVHSLAERHPMLRSRFDDSGGVLNRRLDPSAKPSTTVLPHSPREHAAKAARDVSLHPFRLEVEVPFRFVLCPHNDSSSVIIVAHHIATDFQSQGILLAELLGLCSMPDSRSKGAGQLDDNFAEFVTMEAANEVEHRSADHQGYWRSSCAGVDMELRLPTSHQRPRRRRNRGETTTTVIDPELLAQIKLAARDRGVSLFAYLLAAYELLVGRISGQTDFLVACPSNLRPHSGFEHAVGYFINLLPIRAAMHDQASWMEHLQTTSETVRASLEHREYPYASIVKDLAGDREPSRNPLAEVAFGYQPAFAAGELLDALAAEATTRVGTRAVTGIDVPQQEGQFDLAAEVVESSAGAKLSVRYRSDIFQRAQIQKFSEQYLTILRSVSENPDLALRKVSVSSAEERAWLASVETGEVRLPSEILAPETIWGMAKSRPDHPAICGVVNLTYEQLMHVASGTAHQIKSERLSRRAPIALMFSDGASFAAGALACWAAGYGFLPIDSALPAERVEFMLRDAGVKIVLASPDLSSRIKSLGLRVLHLTEVTDAHATLASPHVVRPNDLAYVIYTSGTTGRPKGVRIEHGSVSHLLEWQRDYFSLAPRDRVLQFASPSFDAFVWELLLVFGSGATLACSDRASAMVGDNLVRLLRELRPSMMTLTPSALSTISPADAPDSVRTIVVAGEACPRPLAADWQSCCRFINAYGPTEATVCATAFEVPADVSTVYIGRPIANCGVRLADENGDRVPAGSIGEMWIFGDNLARGYLARRDLTASRFIEKDGIRFYRSGDLGRWSPDGNLVYEGRADRQVKFRGYRIEPEEIERVLTQHPSVRSAAVTTTELNGALTLMGYVIGNPEVDLVDLRRHVADWLPPYMRPQQLISVSEFPLTSSGKLAAERLPKPDSHASTAASIASSPAMAQVAAIWRSVLPDVQAIDSGSDFFLLGGHSLLAVRAAKELSEHFGIDLTIGDIFSHPRIDDLTSHVLRLGGSSQGGRGRGHRVVKATEGPLPLLETQRAYWVGRSADLELGGLGTTGYVELECFAVDRSKLETAWSSVVSRHDALRMVVRADGSQEVISGAPHYEIIEHKLADLDSASQDAAVRQTRRRLQTLPFDVRAWPSFCIELSQTAAASIVHLSFDGVFIDGTSLLRVIDELSAYYAGRAPEEGEASQFSSVLAEGEPDDQPARFGRAQRYWLNRVDTLPGPPDLPSATVPEKEPRFHSRLRRIAARTWADIRQHAAERGVTPSNTVLAAYAEALARWATNAHFTINVTTSSRSDLGELSEAIGNLTRLLLLELDLTTSMPFAQRARETQRQLAVDLEHSSFSAIRVLREKGRTNGDAVNMPIVFTSMLGATSQATERLGRLTGFASQTPQVTLDHVAFEDEGDLVIVWNCREELFPPGVLDDLFATYCSAIASLSNNDRWEHSLDLPLPADQLAQRQRLNDSQPPASSGILHAGFFEQAARTPNALAVIAGPVTLTYQQLLQSSLAIAERLHNYDLRPGEVIAVSGRRGWERVAAVLGILRAGGAYLPIDFDSPPARKLQLLEEAEVRILVGDRDASHGIGLEHLVHVIVEAPGEKNYDLPADTATPSGLAYVIYTSGSTGKPKGVMVEHGTAMATITDVVGRFGVNARDRVLAVSDLTFDLSVFDLFGPLSVGGAVVIPQGDHALDPVHWARLIHQHEITIWNSVPVLLQLVLELKRPALADGLGSLRRVLLSGDWVPLPLLTQARERLNAKLVSLGGATEASIWSIYHVIDEDSREWDTVPYGVPLAGQRWYVFDQRLRDQPDWTVGELFIGGAGLARGYLRDPARTGERFIRHPHTGERLYRTGDLGRFRNGEIEFRGRLDSQVKVNGHRVELGEIEAALRRHPQVREAVVTAPEFNGRRLLHAFVVPDTTEEPPRATPDILLDVSETVLGKDCITAISEQSLLARGATSNAAALKAMASFEQALEDFATGVMISALVEKGLFSQARSAHTENEIFRRLDVSPSYRRIVRGWLAALASDGTLQETADREFSSPNALKRPNLDELWTSCEESVGWSSNAAPLLAYFRQSSRRIGELLAGRVDAVELLFPDGTLEVADTLYRDNAIMRLCNEIVGTAVATLVAHRDNGERPVRALELGAGTGATTDAVVPVLPLGESEYYFSDLSDYLLERARSRFGQYPSVRFLHLDINELAFTSGLEQASFDMIIAANVLHDAKDVGEVLRQARKLLAPSGYLIIVEGAPAGRMRLISLGFVEGLAAAAEVSEGDPLRTSDFWQRRLKEAGFARVTPLLSERDTPLNSLAESVLLAQAPAHASQVNSEALRLFLGEVLPDYAVPGWFSGISEMPITGSGKIDRRKLEREVAPPRRAVAPLTARGTPASASAVLDIWRSVIGTDAVTLDDNLYETGGDSLTAIRLSALLQEEFEATVTVRDILANPTPRAVSRLLDGAISLKTSPAATEPARPSPTASALSSPVGIDGGVTSYLYNALPLAVIVGTGGENWADSWYVNLYSASIPGREPYIDLTDSFRYSEALKVETVSHSEALSIDAIIPFIRQHITAGRYLNIYVDDHHVRGKPSPYVHEFLVHGFDDHARQLRILGFNDQQVFEDLMVDYDVYTEAFERALTHMTPPNRFADMISQMQILSPPEAYGEYDLGHFVMELGSYLRGNTRMFLAEDRSNWWWWTVSKRHPLEKFHTGVEVHDQLAAYVDSVLDVADPRSRRGLDYRSFHVLYEHKRGLAHRLKRAQQACDVGVVLDFGIETYETLAERFNRARLSVLQYLHRPDRHLIAELPALLRESAGLERDTLARVIEEIGAPR